MLEQNHARGANVLYWPKARSEQESSYSQEVAVTSAYSPWQDSPFMNRSLGGNYCFSNIDGREVRANEIKEDFE